MNAITVLGSDYEEGFADGKAGKPHGTWFGLFLRKGAYETGYNAGIQVREKEMRAAAETTNSDDLLGEGEDAKFYLNLLNETAKKAVDIYDKSKSGSITDALKSPPATTTTAPTKQQQSPIAPPPSASSTNFLTELRMGVPTYAWMLGGGAAVTGLVIHLLRRSKSRG